MGYAKKEKRRKRKIYMPQGMRKKCMSKSVKKKREEKKEIKIAHTFK
jgi:hypothetical protein